MIYFLKRALYTLGNAILGHKLFAVIIIILCLLYFMGRNVSAADYSCYSSSINSAALEYFQGIIDNTIYDYAIFQNGNYTTCLYIADGGEGFGGVGTVYTYTRSYSSGQSTVDAGVSSSSVDSFSLSSNGYLYYSSVGGVSDVRSQQAYCKIVILCVCLYGVFSVLFKSMLCV